MRMKRGPVPASRQLCKVLFDMLRSSAARPGFSRSSGPCLGCDDVRFGFTVSDAGGENRPLDIFMSSDLHENFRGRMKVLAAEFGGLTAIQKVTGIDQSHIGRYVRGERSPSMATLVQLSRGTKKSINWLLGLEDEAALPEPSTALNGPLLQVVIGAVEAYLTRLRAALPSAEKARLIVRLYGHFERISERTPQQRTVLAILRKMA